METDSPIPNILYVSPDIDIEVVTTVIVIKDKYFGESVIIGPNDNFDEFLAKLTEARTLVNMNRDRAGLRPI